MSHLFPQRLRNEQERKPEIADEAKEAVFPSRAHANSQWYNKLKLDNKNLSTERKGWNKPQALAEQRWAFDSFWETGRWFPLMMSLPGKSVTRHEYFQMSVLPRILSD